MFLLLKKETLGIGCSAARRLRNSEAVFQHLKANNLAISLTVSLIAALEPDEVVLGGGNVKKLDALPAGTQAGDNDNAFRGGFRLWQQSANG